MQNGEGLAAAASAALSKKAKAQVKRDLKRAIKPAAKPVKEALHKARKWTDKTFHKVPVLGNLASLPIDVVDDLAQDILPEIKSTRKKWQVPEFVDKLPQPLTANKMAVELNPGPPKSHRKAKKKQAYRKKRAAKGLRPKGMTLRGLLKGAKVGRRTTRMKGLKFRNKKTGASSSGMRMSTSEYLWTTTLAAGSTNAGDEVLQNGLLINPHELNLPELNIEVQRWELYRIKPHIKLESISNGIVDAELFGYYDPDPTDTIPTDAVRRLQIAETHGGSPGYVSKGHTWSPNSKRVRATAAKWFYCDQAGSTGADVRQADQYRFRLLVKRAPRLYGVVSSNTGTSATVDLTINLRISFTIDFRNRTLDQIDAPAAGGMQPMLVYANSGGLMSTVSMTGLAGSTAGSVYTIPPTTPFRRPYLVNNGGVNDTIYRPFIRKCPKYVVVTGQCAASTLSGNPVVGTDINLSAFYNGAAQTSSNTCVWSYFYTVDNTEAPTAGTLSTATTVLGKWGIYGTDARSIHHVAGGVGSIQYNWALNLGNFSAVTTPGAMYLSILEFNEGNELANLERHGPCTVEGIAYSRYKTMPFSKRPNWPDFLVQFQKDREEKKEEITYWKNRALGNDFSRNVERKEYKLSLTPTPSDDEDDWLAYQQQKAAMHKSPGIIGMKPLKIVQDDEKSERGAPRPKAGSQK